MNRNSAPMNGNHLEAAICLFSMLPPVICVRMTW